MTKPGLFAVLAVFFTALLYPQGTAAWWCGGHMITANIAYQQLDANVQAFLQNITRHLRVTGPFPKNADFMQSACWADDIKNSIQVMADWHFVDIPYNPDNITIPERLDIENIEFVLSKFSQTLKHYTKANAWELSFALANFAHFMGDIHQPLHCTTLFNEKFPKGDRGGNYFHVVFEGKLQGLHMVWDSVGGLYTGDDRPLNISQHQYYDGVSQGLAHRFSFPPQMTAQHNFSVIAQETHELAVEYAYAGIAPGETLNATYITMMQNVAQRQLALGGMRLAHQLQYYFKKFQENGVDQWFY